MTLWPELGCLIHRIPEYWEVFFNFFSSFIPSDHPGINYGQWICQFTVAEGFPWRWSLRDNKEIFPFLFKFLEINNPGHWVPKHIPFKCGIKYAGKTEGTWTPKFGLSDQDIHPTNGSSNLIWLGQVKRFMEKKKDGSRSEVSEQSFSIDPSTAGISHGLVSFPLSCMNPLESLNCSYNCSAPLMENPTTTASEWKMGY